MIKTILSFCCADVMMSLRLETERECVLYIRE